MQPALSQIFRISISTMARPHSDPMTPGIAQERLSALSLLGFVPDFGSSLSLGANSEQTLALSHPNHPQSAASGVRGTAQQEHLPDGEQQVEAGSKQARSITMMVPSPVVGDGPAPARDVLNHTSHDGLDFLDVVDMPAVLATITAQDLSPCTSADGACSRQEAQSNNARPQPQGNAQPAPAPQAASSDGTTLASSSAHPPAPVALQAHGSPSWAAPGSPAQRMLALGCQALQATMGALPGRLGLVLPLQLGSFLGLSSSRSSSRSSSQRSRSSQQQQPARWMCT